MQRGPDALLYGLNAAGVLPVQRLGRALTEWDRKVERKASATLMIPFFSIKGSRAVVAEITQGPSCDAAAGLFFRSGGGRVYPAARALGVSHAARRRRLGLR